MTHWFTNAFVTHSAVTALKPILQTSLESRYYITRRYLLFREFVTSSPKMSIAAYSNGVETINILMTLLYLRILTRFQAQRTHLRTVLEQSTDVNS